MRTARPKIGELMALAGVLLLASLLRTGWLGINEFKSDEARLISAALDLVQGRSLPLTGNGASVGLPTSPLSVYLYALPMLVWADIRWATWFTAALNVAAVAMCWWLARRLWGPVAALCAALLLAASPWAAMYSRKIWEPCLLQPFAVGYAITAVLAFVERRPWALTAHLLFAAVLPQLHYSGLVLLPCTALLLVAYRRRLDMTALGRGLVLAALTAVPFAVYLLTHARELLPALNGLAEQHARLDPQSLSLWLMMAVGGRINALAGPAASPEFLRLVPDVDLLDWALGAAVLAGLFTALYGWTRPRADVGTHSAGIVALWAGAPLLLLARHAVPLQLHYYVVAVPAQCLLAGRFLSGLAPRVRPTVRRFVISAVAAAALTKAGVLLVLLQFVARTATPGGFGVPMEYQLRAARRAANSGTQVVVVSSTDDARFGDWPAVFGVLLRGTRHRYINGTYSALFPSAPATLLTAPDAGRALQIYSAAGIFGPEDAIMARRGEEPFRVAALRPGSVPPLVQVTAPNRLANGAEIIGYHLGEAPAPGRNMDWWIAWRVYRSGAQRSEYHVYNHLLDSRGKLSQADGPTVAAAEWTVGDVVVQSFEIPLPADAGTGPFFMRVGMYTYPELQNQPALDGGGNPVGDGITLGPL